MNKVVSLLDGSDKDNKVDPVDDGGPGKHRYQSICDISFSNLDIWNLINGWPDDPWSSSRSIATLTPSRSLRLG